MSPEAAPSNGSIRSVRNSDIGVRHSDIDTTRAAPAGIRRKLGRELDRTINEYAADAIASLGAKRSSFTSEDLAWTNLTLRDSAESNVANLVHALDFRHHNARVPRLPRPTAPIIASCGASLRSPDDHWLQLRRSPLMNGWRL